jgi:hypothetical protein
MTSFLRVDLQIAAIGKRRTMIIIFCTLLQKNKYLKRYILANIIIVLLFFSQSRRFADLKIAAIERRRIMGP